MAFFTLLAWTVASYIVSSLLAGYAASSPGNFSDLSQRYLGRDDFPGAEEGTAAPLVYGRVRFTPHLIWYGNYSPEPVIENINNGFVVVAHRYKTDVQLACGIANGVGRAFKRVWAADKELWSGTVLADDTQAVIVEDEFWGGRGAGGGMNGAIHFWLGSFVMPINTWLDDHIEPTLLPAYRGFMYMHFRDFDWGEQPQLAPIDVEIENIPDELGASATIDCNPADVIYNILREEWGRLGIPAAQIDISTFTAVAATLEAEGHGMSIVFRGGSASDAIKVVLRQIDGVLYQAPSSGKISIRLIREDYTPGALDLFDETNCEVRSFKVGTWDRTYNQVRVKFEDRVYEYHERTFMAQSDGSIAVRGLRQRTLTFPGCKTAAVAAILAHRELRLLSVPEIHVEISCQRNAGVFIPGDVFRWSWSDYGIANMVLRVMDIDFGAHIDGSIILRCARDKYDQQIPYMAIDPAPLFDPPPVTPAAATVWRGDELPRWLGVRATALGIMADAEGPHMLYAAKAPGTIETTFKAEASIDAGATYNSDTPDLQFTNYAEVETAYGRETGPYDTAVGLRIDSLTDSSIIVAASATNIRSYGFNLIRVDDELMSYESFTDEGGGVFTLENVWRGMLDTVPTDHAVNARVWFVMAASFAPVGLSLYNGDETIRHRIITSTGIKRLDPSLAGTSDTVLVERALLAYPPADMNADGQKADFTFYQNEITVDATPRDRLQVLISRGDEASEDGDVDVSTRYDIDGRIAAGGWTENLLADQTPANLNTGVAVPLQLLGAGNAEIRIVAERDVDEGAGTDYRDAYQAPTVVFALPEYRQLLRNPGFDASVDGLHWTNTSGSPVFPGTGTLGGIGKCFHGGAALTTESQIVDVAALSPVGGDALFVWRQTNDSGDVDDRLRVTIHALNAVEATLGNVTTGWIVPTADVWHDNILAYPNLPAGTAKLQVILSSEPINNGGAASKARFDKCGLHFNTVAPITTEQLADEDFEAGGSWTVDSGTWDQNDAVQAVTGVASASCSANGELSQTISTAGYAAGDVIWLQGWRGMSGADAKCQVKLEALEVGAAVEDSDATPLDEESGWVNFDLYVTVTADTVNVRVTLVGATISGGAEVFFDNMLLRFIDQTP